MYGLNMYINVYVYVRVYMLGYTMSTFLFEIAAVTHSIKPPYTRGNFPLLQLLLQDSWTFCTLSASILVLAMYRYFRLYFISSTF